MKRPVAMVIEDDYDAAMLMTEALKGADFDVVVIRDGDTARQELAAQTPALVALDLHLPGVSGELLLQQIRNDERLAQTRVMLVTADDRLAQEMREDADLILLKPVSLAQLRHLAQRLSPGR